MDAVNYSKVLSGRPDPTSSEAEIAANPAYHGYIEELIVKLDPYLLGKFTACAESGLDWTKDSSNLNLYKIWLSSISHLTRCDTNIEARRSDVCDGDSGSDDDQMLNEGLDLQDAELEFIDEEDAIFLLENTDVSAFVTLQSSSAAAVPAPGSLADNLAMIETVQFAPSQPTSVEPAETNTTDIVPVKTVSEISPSEDVLDRPAASTSHGISVVLPDEKDGEKAAPKTNSSAQTCYEVLQTLNKPKTIPAIKKKTKVKKPSVISSSDAIQQRLDIIKEKEKLKEEKEARKLERETRKGLKTPPAKKKRDDSFVASSTPTSQFTDDTTSPESGFTPPRKVLRKKRAILFTASESD